MQPLSIFEGSRYSATQGRGRRLYYGLSSVPAERQPKKTILDYRDTDGKMSVTVVTKTPGGKSVGYRPKQDSALYEIAFEEGGQVPKAMQGVFTGIRECTARIQAWVQSDEAARSAERNARETAAKADKKLSDGKEK
jgi:outer membrane murein-binding lipoprotein Lpp